jgi:bis(5'-adenosyl)-triphosphatase
VKARYKDLDTQELFELSLTIQLLTRFLQKKYGTDSATVTIQEGSGAGQTINHLHVHIIPRRPGDFKNNDEIYPLLESFDDDYVNKLSQANMQTKEWTNFAAKLKEELAEFLPKGPAQDFSKYGHI